MGRLPEALKESHNCSLFHINCAGVSLQKPLLGGKRKAVPLSLCSRQLKAMQLVHGDTCKVRDLIPVRIEKYKSTISYSPSVR
jgi:hypothetical protein